VLTPFSPSFTNRTKWGDSGRAASFQTQRRGGNPPNQKQVGEKDGVEEKELQSPIHLGEITMRRARRNGANIVRFFMGAVWKGWSEETEGKYGLSKLSKKKSGPKQKFIVNTSNTRR